MLYKITDATVSVKGQTILSHIDFEIKGQQKIGIVGRNGAGKTTLLRLIAGELEPDRDDKRSGAAIMKAGNITIGMLRQSNEQDWDKTVEELFLADCGLEDMFSKERFLYEVEYHRLFTGMGFALSMKDRKLSSFSGGEQTKIALIRLLLQKPDILLLDEPTNHLDVAAVEWLEDYFCTYDHAVVFVSHDRFFLDQVVGMVYELEGGRLTAYTGNYTDYRRQKSKNQEIQRKRYEHQQEEIARLNGLIEKFKHKPNKAAFARSRKSMLERMEKLEPPKEDVAHIFTGAIEPRMPGSKWMLEAEHLKVGYEKPLLEISLRVRRGQKIGIIGENGAGKTTLLKTFAGLMEPLEGEYALGNHTMLGYFDQQSAALTSEKTVVEHFRELFPNLTEKEQRQKLGAYLFGGADASKKVGELSGGEKSRLVLAELLCSGPNLLMLDEPTNHMDVAAKETLESAFSSYTGTVLFVSHDRYFVNRVADALLVLEKGQVFYYPFGYEHYIKRRRVDTGENLCAMIQAQDQALVAGLKAVPKAERHRLKEIGTEEAYLDWRLRLAAEPMHKWEQEVALFHEKKYEAATLEEYERLKVQEEEARVRWTQECLAWYDLYNE